MTYEEEFEEFFEDGKYWFKMSMSPIVDAHKFCRDLMMEAYLAGRQRGEKDRMNTVVTRTNIG